VCENEYVHVVKYLAARPRLIFDFHEFLVKRGTNWLYNDEGFKLIDFLQLIHSKNFAQILIERLKVRRRLHIFLYFH